MHFSERILSTSRTLLLFSLLLLGLSRPGAGQDPDLPITLESPRQTMRVHLNYLQDGSYDPQRSARSLAGVPDTADAGELAILLKQVLDATGFVSLGTVPNDPDYRDSTSREAVFFPFPVELPQVYLTQIDGRWYYSEETVSQIPRLHRQIFPLGADFLVRLAPQFSQKEVLGIALWQYGGLILILGVAVLVFFVLNLFIRPLVGRLSKSRLQPELIPLPLINRLTRLLSVFLVLWLIKLALPSLLLPIKTTDFANKTIWILSTVVIMLILFRVLDVVVLYARKATARTENRLDEQLVPVVKTLVQILIVGAVIIQTFRMFHIDITAIIAGLSIGGLALALAAKDTAQNLFGSVTLFLDRPFQVGDWVNFEGVDGTVEEIGIRATRIRTFANSLVYVPNGKLANMNINNYGLRQFRRFKTNISLTYDTPPALIEVYVEGLKGIVANHPKTRKDYYEIHLNAFNASSLDILFYIFFEVPSWSEELKARQEVMLAAIELAGTLGVRFAFPTSTLHVEELPGQASLSPHYRVEIDEKDQRLQQFLEEFAQKQQNGAK